MIHQTIALFSYLINGLINKRLLFMLLVVNIVALLSGGFIAELSLVNSQLIGSAFQAELLRYALLVLMLLMVISNIVEDFESRQFERIFCMPLDRWQYVISQLLIVFILSLLLAISAFPFLMFTTSFELATYWSLALWIELFLMGNIALLAASSLEKVPSATILSFSLYGLARLAPTIDQMLVQSVAFSESLSSQFAQSVFSGLMTVLPGTEAFARNNSFFDNVDFLSTLLAQGFLCAVYSFMVIVIALIDIYRKELTR